ncbi:MAG TPA: hypothetical protein VF914_07600 [Chloroflexia bacterium]|jgi:hypothetical protein
MSLMERDEYAARYGSKGRRTGREVRVLLLWLAWIPLTVLGAVVGRQLGLVLDNYAEVGGVLYFGELVLRGVLVGGVLGGVQGLLLWDYLHLRGWLTWTGATALGWAGRDLALYYAGGPIVNTMFDWGGPSLPLIGGVSGLVGGLMLGIAQSLVVRYARLPIEQIPWLLACMGGAALGRIGAGFAMNFGSADSLVAVAGAEALGVAFLTTFAQVGVRRRRAAEAAALRNIAAQREEEGKANAEPDVVRRAGEWQDMGHGIALAMESVDVGDNITWHLVARNTGRSQARLTLDPHKLRVNDSTRKLYRISGVHLHGTVLAPNATTHLEVQADILSFAPVPLMATYLDLVYTPASGTSYAFRQPLPTPANTSGER